VGKEVDEIRTKSKWKTVKSGQLFATTHKEDNKLNTP
jgi:hypothetical protein